MYGQGDRPAYEKPILWLPFINDDDEAVPPCAAMEFVSIDEDGFLHCQQPSVSGLRHAFINGMFPVQAGAQGMCSNHPVGVAAYDYLYDPEPGQIWGTLKDSWYIHKGEFGFVILGGETGSIEGESTNCIVNVARTIGTWTAIVRIVGTAGSGSGSGGAGRYDGYLQTFDPVTRAYTDGEAIWIECDPNSDVDVGYVQGIHVGFAESRLVFFVDRSWINDAGSGSGGDCRTTLGGVTLSNLGVLTSPTHVLGIDANGCIGLIELTEC
jgi:hypothetical protein